MPAKFDAVAEGFRRAMRELVDASPLAMRDTLRAEAAIILKTCAVRTKVAKKETVTRGARLGAARHLGLNGGNREGDIYINVGIRGDYGKIWRRTRGREGFQQTHAAGFAVLNRHFPDKVWIDLKEAVADFGREAGKRVPAALAARGLARQSWVQIADSMGIRLEDVPGTRLSGSAISQARAAISSTRPGAINGLSQEERQQASYVLRLINNLPYGPKAKLDQVLAWVIGGRSAYFRRNLALGVFRSQEKLLRAYPGLKISLPA